MRPLQNFIGKYGEGKLYDFLDAVRNGYSDQWIADHVLHIARQHVGRYRRMFFVSLVVFSEPAESVLREMYAARRGTEDMGERMLDECSIIRVRADGQKRLRATSENSK